MRYSLLAGGKRIRPVLALATASATGRDPVEVLPLAGALELIHTYSLIHDDLPAMDDDDMRRGRPTCHVKFGEDVAILAGDGLYAEAFRLVLHEQKGDPASILAAVSELAAATGVNGMVGGQYIDVRALVPSGAATLRRLHELKTGRLIGASVECVLLLTGREDQASTLPHFRNFAAELGVLFQIVDDILDVTGTDDALGKPQGSDERHGKVTYVTQYGLDGARDMAAESHRNALSALRPGRPRRRRGARAHHRLHLHPTLMTRILDRIDGPTDLHGLSDDELQQVAQEVRELLIDTVGEIGGHFGANLGACEIAVALHSLLDSPRDKILWDVGHQAYPHKILTGRRDQIATIRKYDGLAPFCSIVESEHDIMGAGHASTSIGYAVGLKEAMRHGNGEDGRVVAVIGDGAMTGGVAFEAIHQAGGLGTPMVVVLNDNGMSISPNVGALSRYFNRMRLEPGLWRAREGVEEKLTKLPAGIGAAFERLGPQLKESIKAFTSPGLWWEELDWAYMGVIDGHDVRALRRALRRAFEAERPVVVHVATVKGKGFAPAEDGGLEGMEKWHAAKPNSIAKRMPAAEPAPKKSARQAAVHAGLRRGARARVRARRARRRHHRRDELRHRPHRSSRRPCPTATSTSASPSSRPCCSPPAWRSRARGPSARSTRPSCSAPTTRSSTTSASRACRSSSAWTAPGSSATTARPTTASSTSPTCAACRT